MNYLIQQARAVERSYSIVDDGVSVIATPVNYSGNQPPIINITGDEYRAYSSSVKLIIENNPDFLPVDIRSFVAKVTIDKLNQRAMIN